MNGPPRFGRVPPRRPDLSRLSSLEEDDERWLTPRQALVVWPAVGAVVWGVVLWAVWRWLR